MDWTESKGLSQVLRLANKLTSDQKKFFAEVIGTFVIVVIGNRFYCFRCKIGQTLGIPVIAFDPFVGVSICVYLFG